MHRCLAASYRSLSEIHRRLAETDRELDELFRRVSQTVQPWPEALRPHFHGLREGSEHFRQDADTLRSDSNRLRGLSEILRHDPKTLGAAPNLFAVPPSAMPHTAMDCAEMPRAFAVTVTELPNAPTRIPGTLMSLAIGWMPWLATAIPFGKSPKAMAAAANGIGVRSKGKEEEASLGAPPPKVNRN